MKLCEYIPEQSSLFTNNHIFALICKFNFLGILNYWRNNQLSYLSSHKYNHGDIMQVTGVTTHRSLLKHPQVVLL